MKYYFVTGTSRGIGKSVCDRLSEDENHQIFGFSRSDVQDNKNYRHIPLDLSDIQKTAQYEFPELCDAELIVLINNAGSLGEIKHIGNRNAGNIVENININLTAPLLLMNAFTAKYQDLKCQRLILNISSGAGRHAVESWSSYCASKAGLDMLSEVFKIEQNMRPAENRITVFSLAPGIVDTRMQDEIRNVDTSDFSGKDLFVSYKNQNLLWSSQKVSEYIIEIIENTEKYKDTILDVRTIELQNNKNPKR